MLSIVTPQKSSVVIEYDSIAAEKWVKIVQVELVGQVKLVEEVEDSTNSCKGAQVKRT